MTQANQSLSSLRGFLFQHKKALSRVLAALLALVVWQAVAMMIGERLILVSPLSVLARLGTIWREAGFLEAIWFSISRTTVGFLLALLGGTLLALPAARFPVIETLLSPYMLTVKSVPVASFIVLLFVWFSPETLSAFVAFLIVLPTVYNNLLAGLRSVDPKMLEMAKVFHLSFPQRLVAVYLPHMRPYILSACSLAAGLAWKSGVAAEIIAVPSGSIGNMIYYAGLWLVTEDLFAWTVIIVLFSIAFEKLFVGLVRLLFRLLLDR